MFCYVPSLNSVKKTWILGFSGITFSQFSRALNVNMKNVRLAEWDTRVKVNFRNCEFFEALFPRVENRLSFLTTDFPEIFVIGSPMYRHYILKI